VGTVNRGAFATLYRLRHGAVEGQAVAVNAIQASEKTEAAGMLQSRDDLFRVPPLSSPCHYGVP
jgi:hypothetical protein